MNHKDEASIFLEAIEYNGPMTRDAFLHQACHGDDALKKAVMDLIHAHHMVDETPDFLVTPHLKDIAPADFPPDNKPSSIGPYRILEPIGFGNFSNVYKAELEPSTGCFVAVKIIHERVQGTSTLDWRFDRELKAICLLKEHPNIITVNVGGIDKGYQYIAMEYVEGGRTLKDLIRNQPNIQTCLKLATGVASGLAYAHQQGILHRDIKPTNVLLSQENHPLLADFGLAKQVNCQESNEMTATGAIMGTPYYMSPEQCGFGDRKTDTQSDIYSFGVLLYELFTCVMPYEFQKGIPLSEVFEIIRSKEPRNPRELNQAIQSDLAKIILKCIQKDKWLRYEKMDQILEDLTSVSKGKSVKAVGLSPGERIEKHMRRQPKLAFTIIISIACFMGVLSFFLRSQESDETDSIIKNTELITLTKEINQLKEETHSNQLPGVYALLEQTRDDIKNQRITDAETKLKQAIDWSLAHDHEGAWLKATSELARLKLMRGQFVEAFNLFTSVKNNTYSGLFTAQLAQFESGVCHWLEGNKDRARDTWQNILSSQRLNSFSEASIAVELEDPFYRLVSSMLDRNSYERLETDMEKPSTSQEFDTLKPLVYWVLSANAQTQSKASAYTSKAKSTESPFHWIHINTQ